jgi:hypothetical protein
MPNQYLPALCLISLLGGCQSDEQPQTTDHQGPPADAGKSEGLHFQESGSPMDVSRKESSLVDAAPSEDHPSMDTSALADLSVPTTPRLWVFIMAGQSNMVGLGKNAELTAAQAAPVPNVTIYYNASIHPNTNTLKWMPLGPGFGASNDHFGPELGFGQKLHALYPNRQIAIIKVAEGGTGLSDRWAAGVGDLYQLLINEVTAQLAVLAQTGRPQLAGFLWMQGENDASQQSTADAYQGHLAEFIWAVRQNLGVAILPFTAGLISPAGGWPFVDIVRTATALVAQGIGQVDVVETNDLPTHADDRYHYTTASNLMLGQRFADAAAKMMETQWSFPGSFGAAQGDHFFTYRDRLGSTITFMAYDPASSRYSTADVLGIGDGWMHPGPTHQAELALWFPLTGRAEITATVSAVDPGAGDGVTAEIANGAQSFWGPVAIARLGTASRMFQLDVVQGSELFFRTGSGAASNHYFDTTSWNIGIKMIVIDQ